MHLLLGPSCPLAFFQEVRLCASTVCRTHRLAGLESGFEVRLEVKIQ
jgi:hypothetical protein